jgi:hypothetical protein
VAATYAFIEKEGVYYDDRNVSSSTVLSESVLSIASSSKYLGTSPTGVDTLRFYSQGDNTFIDLSKAVITIKYQKEKDYNKRDFYTPLVDNPIDQKVYGDILKVLARVDRDYVVDSGTIISQTAWNEIKDLTPLNSNEKVQKLFRDYEKLQKDETLANVFSFIVNNASSTAKVGVTRETLEELYMVSLGILTIPDSGSYYAATSTRTITSSYSPSWKYMSYYSSPSESYACTPMSSLYGCVFTPPLPDEALSPAFAITQANLTVTKTPYFNPGAVPYTLKVSTNASSVKDMADFSLRVSTGTVPVKMSGDSIDITQPLNTLKEKKDSYSGILLSGDITYEIGRAHV